MDRGDKVKLKFGGGLIGVITEVKRVPMYQVSYPIDGKPATGVFTEVELEITDEDPAPREFRGFRATRDEDD